MESGQSLLKREEFTRNVLFDDLNDLCAGVIAFGDGPTAALGTTASQMSAIGAMAFLSHDAGRRHGSFAQRVAADIKATIENGTLYSGSWDYDGPGAFHKASMSVVPYENDGKFALHVHAAYVGNEPEKKLAKNLRKPIGLQAIQITRNYPAPSDGDRFSIPWSELENLWLAFGGTPPTPEDFIDRVFNRSKADIWSSQTQSMQIDNFGPFSAHIGASSYSVPRRMRTQRVEIWSIGLRMVISLGHVASKPQMLL